MTQSGPLVSIVVVSYNTREMTLACLRSVIAETRVPYELIVLDNGSLDGSAQAIASEFPEIKLLAESENHGFARANNLATRHARGDYILLLNPDTVVLNSAIDKIVEFARAKPKAKIWGGRTLFPDGTLNGTSCYQRMTVWNLFCRATGLTAISRNHPLFSECYGSWDIDHIRQVEIVTGCFFLIERQLWEKLRGFDPTYFMYGEEVDLCLRATRQHGAKPHFTPDAVIIHYGGGSEPVRADKLVRLLRAKMTLVRQHFAAWERPLGEHLLTMIPLSRYSALSALAAVTRHKGAQESARVWEEVWARRTEWRDGWKSTTHS